jgi:hypothetical protein
MGFKTYPGLAYAAAFMAVCRVVSADESSFPLNLAVVTVPKGGGFEAELARSLVPQGSSSQYKLTPIDELLTPGPASEPDEIEQDLKKIEEKAEEAALDFDLVRAAGLKRQIADTFLDTGKAGMNLTLAAEYLMEAGAASMEAGERDLALSYFRKAIAVDSEIQPGPTISPQARDLFESAVDPSFLEIPPEWILRKLSGRLNTDGILWISVGRDEQGLKVSQKSSQPEVSQQPPADDKELADWINKEKNRIHTMISLGMPGEPVAKKAWYEKWWVWTAVGGVILAGAAGVAISIGLQPEEVDVTVHH